MSDIIHQDKALVSKLYSSVQSQGGMNQFMGTSVFQFIPSVQHTNYKFRHKHCLGAYHKKLAESDLYQCILYVLYSVHHAAVTFDDCSRLKMQPSGDFYVAVYCNKCCNNFDVLCGYAKTFGVLFEGQNCKVGLHWHYLEKIQGLANLV